MLKAGLQDCQPDLKSLCSTGNRQLLLVGFVGVMMLYCPEEKKNER
jgi:hypothetical protein